MTTRVHAVAPRKAKPDGGEGGNTPVFTLRMPTEMRARIEKLSAALSHDPRVSGGAAVPLTRTMLMALARGLDELEAEVREVGKLAAAKRGRK